MSHLNQRGQVLVLRQHLEHQVLALAVGDVMSGAHGFVLSTESFGGLGGGSRVTECRLRDVLLVDTGLVELYRLLGVLKPLNRGSNVVSQRPVWLLEDGICCDETSQGD